MLAGAGLLWLGWAGFNGGDPFSANIDSSIAVINTNICAATSLLMWTSLDVLVFSKPSVIGAVQGMITGLVVITPAAGRYTRTTSSVASLLIQISHVGGGLWSVSNCFCFWNLTTELGENAVQISGRSRRWWWLMVGGGIWGAASFCRSGWRMGSHCNGCMCRKRAMVYHDGSAQEVVTATEGGWYTGCVPHSCSSRLSGWLSGRLLRRAHFVQLLCISPKLAGSFLWWSWGHSAGQADCGCTLHNRLECDGHKPHPGAHWAGHSFAHVRGSLASRRWCRAWWGSLCTMGRWWEIRHQQTWWQWLHLCISWHWFTTHARPSPSHRTMTHCFPSLSLSLSLTHTHTHTHTPPPPPPKLQKN